MSKITAKHLTKEEIKRCNELLNSDYNINSCIYQAIEKNVFEFINAKEALYFSKRNFDEFKNNESLHQQVNDALDKATIRFNKAKAIIFHEHETA